MKKKIVFIIPSLYGGGAEKQLELLTKQLSQHDSFEVTIVYMNKISNGFYSKINNVNYLYLRKRSYFLKLLSFIAFLKKEKPDIVQSTVVPADIFAGIARLLIHFNWIMRETNDMSKRNKSLKLILRKLLAFHSSFIVCNSISSSKYWRLLEKKIIIIKNGIEIIDPKFYEKANENKRLLYVGRLEPHKNVLQLINAFKDRKFHNCKLFIIGKGSLENEIIEKIKNIDEVEFKPYMNTEDLKNYYNKADIFCNLSDYEGMPNTVLEAASSSCFLLLSSNEAHSELFDNNSALFIKTKTRIDILNAINESIQLVINRKHLNKAKKSHNISLSYSKINMVKSYIHLYNKLK